MSASTTPVLLRPRWLAGHVLALVLVVLFLNLGAWQLRRLEARTANNEVISSRSAASPVDLSTAAVQRPEEAKAASVPADDRRRLPMCSAVSIASLIPSVVAMLPRPNCACAILTGTLKSLAATRGSGSRNQRASRCDRVPITKSLSDPCRSSVEPFDADK